MTHDLSDLAKNLRRNPTDAEKLIWKCLRNSQLGCKFRRQHNIGRYIVDFICIERWLVIEIDGGQHSPEKDAARTKFLTDHDYTILRFWNNEVLRDIEGVYQRITEFVNDSPSPRPSPHRGEGATPAYLSNHSHDIKSTKNTNPDSAP